MGGGLMQLVAYGAQDIYLTGNPQITFFKVVYRRHTNFSMESIQQTFSGGGTTGTSPVCTISRNGDLVHKMYLVQTTGGTAAFTPEEANRVITTVELEIGGQRIDRQSSRWMDTWNELSTPESKVIGLKAMTGQIGSAGDATTTNNTGVSFIRIPLQFWFCRNPGLALPLIALQYHEVKVKFALGGMPANAKFDLYCDYIYLDTDERRRFAQVSHEYLIEQVQEQTTTSKANKLNFNHPVKELIWSTDDTAGTGALKLNGHDRFSERKAEYFELQQPYDYHTAVPAYNLPSAAYAAARAPTTTYEKIDNTLVWAQDVDGMAGNDHSAGSWNSLLHDTNDGTTSATAAAQFVARANVGPATPTKFISVGGAAAALGIGAGSIKKGDLHLVEYTDSSDPAGTKSTITRVNQLLRTAAGATVVTKDGTNAPTKDTDITTLDGDELGTQTLVIEYEDIVIGPSARHVPGDILSIRKIADAGGRTSASTKHIGVYSFALKPEEHQPSGTCNFSRIDNAELTFGAQTVNGVIYAVNYNVLRIMSGMGGLAYSN